MNLNMFEGYEIENKIELDFDDTYIHWFKTLCAFANTDGGIMNVGITDSLYEIGFPLNEIDHIRRSVNNYCFNHSKPILKCDFEVVKIENKENRYYLRIIVKKRESALTWLVDNKNSPLLYIRHSGSSDLATIEEQVSLLLTSNMYEYDKVETGIKLDDASFDKLDEEYSQSNNNESLTKKKKISFGLVTDDDYLTIAGILFSDKNYNKNANVVCTTWKSLTKGTNEYENDQHYDGSLIYLLHKAIEYIKEVPSYFFGGEKKDLRRIDKGSFSIIALREALVNALAHRDYKIDGNEIMIDCFPDRIEITSPGSMLHLSEEVSRRKIDANSFASFRRNRTICTIFEKCRLMENKGSGFEKIVDDYKDYSDEYAPLFSANKISFTIILKNKKYKYNNAITENSVEVDDFGKIINKSMFIERNKLFETNPRYKEIQYYIENNKLHKIDDIATELGITSDGVKYNIRKMKDACLIRKALGGYEVVNDIDRPAEYLSLSKEELLKVIKWCKENFVASKTTLTDCTSYYLKHVLERDINMYLSNGQFKAAMLLAGFETNDVEKLNWNFKILKSSPALKKESKA